MHPYFKESVLVGSQGAHVSYWKEENGDERRNGIYLEKMQSYRFRTKVGIGITPMMLMEASDRDFKK